MITCTIFCLVGVLALIAGADTEPDDLGNRKKLDSDHPWTVRIVGKDTMCTGALIDKIYVLTTASCLPTHSFMNPREFMVILGDYGGKNNRKQEIMVKDIVIYTYFNRVTGENNVALINLAREARVGGRRGVMPIRRLASESIQDQIEPGKSSCVISGYGMDRSKGKWRKNNVLQSSRAYPVSDSRCSRIPWFVTESNVCYKSVNDDICRKDDGSPIVCEILGSYWLAGLHVTQSTNGCDRRINGAVGVAKYRRWIRTVRRYGEGKFLVNYFLVKKWRMFYKALDINKVDPNNSPVDISEDELQAMFAWYTTHVASTARAGQPVNVDDFVQSLADSFTYSETAFTDRWRADLLSLAVMFDQNNDGHYGKVEFLRAFNAFGFNDEGKLLKYFRSFGPKCGLLPLSDAFIRPWVYFLTNDNHAKTGINFWALDNLQPPDH